MNERMSDVPVTWKRWYSKTSELKRATWNRTEIAKSDFRTKGSGDGDSGGTDGFEGWKAGAQGDRRCLRGYEADRRREGRVPVWSDERRLTLSEVDAEEAGDRRGV